MVSAALAKGAVVLLIHAGGWAFGSPSDMDQVANWAGEMGMQPVEVSYPLFDMPAAQQAVRQAALEWRRQGRRVYAYGESAGGSMAALLAAEGRVDRATANAPPTNLLTWTTDPIYWSFMQASVADRRRFSPALQKNRNPVLTMASPDDTIVNWGQSISYARKFRSVRFQPIAGAHLVDLPDSYICGPICERNAKLGLRWLSVGGRPSAQVPSRGSVAIRSASRRPASG